MTNNTVEVNQEALTRLRTFANTHADEYGGLELYRAILDAGLALDCDDPTPNTPPEQIDLDALRDRAAYDDEDIDEYVEAYRTHCPESEDA